MGGLQEVNVLKPHLRITVLTLLASGTSQREIARRTGVHRDTIRSLAAKWSTPATGSEAGEVREAPRSTANWATLATGSDGRADQTPPPRPPAPKQAVSACAEHRSFIEAQVALGRNAMAIYQGLVDDHGFAHRYNSVKRFVRTLKAREPERFDVLEFLPGEEAQVDYGLGALTRLPNGKYKRPYLFVMTLKYSGKSFRKVVWKTDQQVWARLHEEAFRALAGCPAYVVLDNLKEGVIKPDLYEPALNSVYAELLAHYGVVGDPCRVADPNRKGTVESAIQHTQSTALKGRRFETIEAQNAFLAHWEERWAAPRIHGRKKRQVLELYQEERPHLKALPVESFQYFHEGVRTVDDAGLVQVDGRYYAALPARLYSQVKVRIFDHHIHVLAEDGTVLRRHEKAVRKGSITFDPADRIFNPSRETNRLLTRLSKIGPHTAQLGDILFRSQGRLGRKSLYGLSNLPRRYACEDIEAVVQTALAGQCHSYRSIERALQRRAELAKAQSPLTQAAPEIRDLGEYQSFFDTHTQPPETP
jgi:transposase